jgi:enoyl-CoA hydratase/carnithine racemase
MDDADGRGDASPDPTDPDAPFEYETVRYDRRDGVAVVTIDRPDARNAVDDETARGLRDAWRRFNADDEALVGILTGAGETFSAGADLKRMDLVDPGEALTAARYLAAGVAEHPQITVKPDRAALYGGLGESLDAGLKIEAWHGTRALDTAAEGADRFAAGEGRGGEGVQ